MPPKTTPKKAEKSPYCSCLSFVSHALSRVMTEIADESFGVLGLPSAHGFLLMSVNDVPGISASELAERTLLAPSTVTRHLDKLEAHGFVRRKTEGRVVRVEPLAKARKIQSALKDRWTAVTTEYTRILGDETARTLTAQMAAAQEKIKMEKTAQTA